MSDAHRLFADLEATLTNGAGQQRFTILRKITDLFLAEVDYYSDDHVAVFDQLMSRLIDRIERQALVELSGKLAPVGRAPANVIGLLSNNDDIDVAGPVLAQSGILTDEELVAIAESESQAHLDAIAGRSRVNEPITDVLIDRGNAEVAHKITANPGARFSRFGFSTAMTRAEDDNSLAMAVAARLDLPDDLLEQLVGKASMTVQQRLLANAAPRCGSASTMSSPRYPIAWCVPRFRRRQHDPRDAAGPRTPARPHRGMRGEPQPSRAARRPCRALGNSGEGDQGYR